MSVAIVDSKNSIAIRLTEERWAHILEEHGELAEMQSVVLSTVAEPMAIYAGNAGELLAIRPMDSGKWMVVVYRETNGDGFIITAFMTRRTRAFERREKKWP